MKHLKITFHTTVMEDFGNYRLGRSVGDHLIIEVSYKTENFKRALAFAKRKVELMKRKDNSLYNLNTTIELI